MASIGKTAEDVRADYSKQAKEAIALDLILSKIAEWKVSKLTKKKSTLPYPCLMPAISKSMNLKGTSKETTAGINPERRKALDSLLNLS